MHSVKILIVVFLVTLFAYVAGFTLIEHRRIHNGPWEITFTTETNAPAIVINQLKLNIRNVKIIFPGAPTTNTTETIVFADARQTPFDVPFGQCVFLDTITLPGNVTLKVFGHEIQLLPRVLTIDGKEQAWRINEVLFVKAKK